MALPTRRRKKRAKQTAHYVGMERIREVRGEVQALYLAERLRKSRKARDPLSRLSVKQGKHFVGRARLSH